MDELHGKQNNSDIIGPKEGQRGFLCSNKELFRCPFLGFNSEEDQALDCLAGILVEAFINKKKHEAKTE